MPSENALGRCPKRRLTVEPGMLAQAIVMIRKTGGAAATACRARWLAMVGRQNHLVVDGVRCGLALRRTGERCHFCSWRAAYPWIWKRLGHPGAMRGVECTARLVVEKTGRGSAVCAGRPARTNFR